MDLDKIAVHLRPRTPYEAVDLGFVLVRKFWRPLLVGWLAGALPFFVAAALIAALTPMFWLPLLALWWLKPLFDRIALFVLSRGFFGDLPPLKRTLGHTLRGWRSWAAISDITWRRFYGLRSVAMPVRELEQLRGSAASERLKLLFRRDIRTPGIMLWVVGFSVECMLLIASIVLLTLMVPEASGIDIGAQVVGVFDGTQVSATFKVYVFAMYFISMAAVETVYVASGFGLYINRRVGLEGWDIELTFRRLARRLHARSRALGRAAMIFLIGLGLSFATASTPAFAQPKDGVRYVDISKSTPENPEGYYIPGEEGEDPNSALDAQAEIAEILKDPVFGEDTTEKTWRVREGLFKNDADSKDNALSSSFISSLSSVAEIIVWLFVLIFVLVAVYFILKKTRIPVGAHGRDELKPIQPPTFEAVEHVVQISLPDDIVAAAMAAWQRGEMTESLSLLYRGTIRGLALGYRIEVDPSMTARQSIQMVREAGGPVEYISELAAAWTQVVYAGRGIEDEEAAGLFAAWKHHFSASKPEAP